VQQPRLDYSTVAQHVSHASIVGFGESTHGTHEFFVTKAEVFKLLVAKHAFNTLFFESIDDYCESVSAYLRTGDGNLEALVNKLFYFYRSQEVLDLFRWLRKRYKEYPVRIVGLDERKHINDYAIDYDLAKLNLRDKRMAKVVKTYLAGNSNAKGMIWAHDAHVATYVNAPLSYKEQMAPMGRHLRRWLGKDYYAVAQLFGTGEFSAALIEGSGTSDNSKLVAHSTPYPDEDFWEHKLLQRIHSPSFLEGPTFGDLVKPHEIRKLHSIGWGVRDSKINDAAVWVDLCHAYNAVIFFPQTSASHRLCS
jgi:erythromycin esterase-like protein